MIFGAIKMKKTMWAALLLGLAASSSALADQNSISQGISQGDVLGRVRVISIEPQASSNGTSNIGKLGSVGVLPPTVLLQYHFNPHGKIRPYVGAGLNYTLFYNSDLSAGSQPVSVGNHSFGGAVQAGVDVQVARNLFVNFDVKQLWMRTSATMGGQSLGTLRINPLVVGVGLGMKF